MNYNYMAEKNVSVIIATYNRAHVLHKTIASYLQEVTLEVIMVDDGSDDGTKDAVRQLHEKYSEIKYIRLKKNKGITYARNIGMSRAKGKYIFFGDDDAVLYPGTLLRLRDALETHPADIAGANGSYARRWKEIECMDEYIKSQFTEPFRRRCMVEFDTGVWKYDYKIENITEGLFVLSCFMIRTELAQKEKYDIRYTKRGGWEDVGYNLQHAEQGRTIVYVPDAYEIDIPRSVTKKGGCIEEHLWKRFFFVIWNWNYLLSKHYEYLKREGYISISKTKSVMLLVKKWIRMLWNNML